MACDRRLTLIFNHHASESETTKKEDRSERGKRHGFGSSQWRSRIWSQERSASCHLKEKNSHPCPTTQFEMRCPLWQSQESHGKKDVRNLCSWRWVHKSRWSRGRDDKKGCSLSSEETTNGGQDRRRHEYVFVRTSLFVRRHGVETGFPSSQGDRRQCATLLADVAYWVCWEVHPRSGTNPERARGIRKWAQKVPQAVTTDVLLLGKYELPMQTASVLGAHSQGSQSFQTSRVIGTRQC